MIGLPPAAAGEHSTIPPRAEGGGNIDCRDTLYLPVTFPGALLHLGDGHAAQGDGEVGGTAIECPMTTKVALDLVTDPGAGRYQRGRQGDRGIGPGIRDANDP